MLAEFLDLFFPRSSLRGSSGAWMTSDEWKDIPLRVRTEHSPSLQARGLSALDSLTSACDYRDSLLLQRAIYTFKYKRVPELGKRLGEFIIEAGARGTIQHAVLVPVPLHWVRLFDRGFNQANLLALFASQAFRLPVRHLLRRTRDTGHQAWRTRAQRMSAMHGAFAVRRPSQVTLHVILIDDISTTGATLDACARVLKLAGAKRVDAWVIARG